MAKQGRIFAVIFLALLIPVLLAAPESEAKVYRGKCKSNLTWSYDSKTKTMVIDCKGDMPDDEQFYDLDMGWKEYYLKTKKVIFKKGISSIGAGAFDNFPKLEEIALPEGLRTIKYAAFWDCNSLNKINIPLSLRKIEKIAFDSSGLTKFSLKNIKKVGSNSFMRSDLVKISIPANCKIGSFAFWDCKNLKKATIEKGVKNISAGMFCATALKNITIPGSVTKIGEDAFSYCQNLKKATINEGVKKISKDAFSNTALEEITIPSTVTQLGKNAFRWESTEKSSLKKVVIRSKNIKKWGTMVFGATRDDLVIYVPQSKKAEYEKILRSTNGLDFHAKIVGKNW